LKNSGQIENISNPFENALLIEDYDNWYEENRELYEAELKAIKELIPFKTPLEKETGLEIGVGTGRFASPLGIKFGLDSAFYPLKIAKKRNLNPIKAKAELLPIKSNTFDIVLYVTTICFLENPKKAILETKRILKKEGYVIIAFIDKDSPLGKKYEKKKQKSPFYSKANFLSETEIKTLLTDTGFNIANTKKILDGFTIISAKNQPN